MSFENEFTVNESSDLNFTENSQVTLAQNVKQAQPQKQSDNFGFSGFGFSKQEDTSPKIDKPSQQKEQKEQLQKPKRTEELNQSWDSLMHNNVPNKDGIKNNEDSNNSICVEGRGPVIKSNSDPKERNFGDMSILGHTGGFDFGSNSEPFNEPAKESEGTSFGFGFDAGNNFKKKQSDTFGFGNNNFGGSSNGFGNNGNSNGFGNNGSSNGFGSSFDGQIPGFQPNDNFSNNDFGNRGFGGGFRGRGGSRGGFRGRGRGRGGFNNFGNRSYGGGFSDNQSQSGSNYNYSPPIYNATSYDGGNRGGFNNFPPPPTSPPVEVKPEGTSHRGIIDQNEKIPNARICWPNFGLYVLGVEITFTVRQINKFKTDILVLPFKDTKFKVYPGIVINSCYYNYRQRINQKIQADQLKDGSVYIKKSLGNDDYKYFAFIKINDEKQSTNFVDGLKGLFGILHEEKCKNLERTRIVIPVSEATGNSEQILRCLIESIEELNNANNTTIKQIFVNSETPESFAKNVEAFRNVFCELIDDCRISLD